MQAGSSHYKICDNRLNIVLCRLYSVHFDIFLSGTFHKIHPDSWCMVAGVYKANATVLDLHP